MALYRSLVEFRYREGSSEAAVLNGGEFFVFLVADDARHILQRIERAVAEQSVDVFAVEFIALYEGCTWDDPAEAEHYAALVQHAQASSDVVFDGARVFKDDD